MKARINWVGDRTFVGEAGTGHAIAFGTAHGEAGAKPGPSPMDLVLIGTGGCAAWDVVHILERGREAIEGCTVELDAERATEDPKVFTKVHMHFVLRGRALDPKKVERAIKLSAEKYCSASAMIGKTAEITHDFEVIDTATPQD
jgi:putative redox protein